MHMQRLFLVFEQHGVIPELIIGSIVKVWPAFITPTALFSSFSQGPYVWANLTLTIKHRTHGVLVSLFKE